MPGSSTPLSIPLFLVMVLTPCAAHADAWTQSPGSYYFKITAEYLYSEKEFNADGETVDILADRDNITETAFRDVTFRAYAEYGVRQRLTGIISVPFSILTARRTEMTDLADLVRRVEAINGGLGDMMLGARFHVAGAEGQKYRVSVQSMLKMPLGYARRPGNGGPSLGSGFPDIDARVNFGLSLYPFPGWAEARAGYALRGGSLHDAYFFGADLGAAGPRGGGKVALSVTRSIGSIEMMTESSTVVVANSEEIKLSPAAWVTVGKGVSVTAEAYHPLEGRNTVAGTKWAVGVVIQH